MKKLIKILLVIMTVFYLSPTVINAQESPEINLDEHEFSFDFFDNKEQKESFVDKEGNLITITLKSVGPETEYWPTGTYKRRIEWSEGILGRTLAADYEVSINPYISQIKSISNGSYTGVLGTFNHDSYYISQYTSYNGDPAVGDYIVWYDLSGGTHKYTLRASFFEGGRVVYNVFGTW